MLMRFVEFTYPFCGFFLLFLSKGFFSGCGRDCAWCLPRDCRDVQELGFTTSGLYHVTKVGTFSGFDVWCDLDTEGGGWLVCIKRRS